MEKFAKGLVQRLKDRAEPGVEVQLNEVTKVNDQKFHAINIVRPDERISRLFYLEMYHQSYLNDGVSLEEIADDILKTYQENNELSTIGIDSVNRIWEYETVKSKIIVKLINKDRNNQYLQDKVYVNYLDLAVCFCLMLEQPDEVMASIAVTKELFSRWEISLEELYSDAMENMNRMFPARITSFYDILSEIYSEFGNDSFAEIMNPPKVLDDIGMYIISNERKVNGAATLLCKDLIRQFAEKHQVEKVYIIPSSVHELILIPDSSMVEIESLNEMVVSVNTTVMSPMEILSDHVYVYVYEKDEIQ